MTASFRIDQPDGAGAGTMGYARDGLWRDREVVLTAYPAGSYAWALLDKPYNSTATLVASEIFSSVCHFTPDVNGTYRIRLIAGNQTMIRVARVDRSSTGVRDGVWALPGFREAANEDNIGGNERGSAPVLEKIFGEIWDGIHGAGTSRPTGAAGGDLSEEYPDPRVARLQGAILDWSVSSPPSAGLLRIRDETSPPRKLVSVLTPSPGYLEWTGSGFAWSSPGAAASPYVIYDPSLTASSGSSYKTFAEAYTAAAAMEGFPTILVKNHSSFDFGAGTYNLENRISIIAHPDSVVVQASVATGTVFQNPYKFRRIKLVNASENPVFTTSTGYYNASFVDGGFSEDTIETTTWFAQPTSGLSVVSFEGTGDVSSVRPLFAMNTASTQMYVLNSWEIVAPVVTGTDGAVAIVETSTGTHSLSPDYTGSLSVNKPALSLQNFILFNSLATEPDGGMTFNTLSSAVEEAQRRPGNVTIYVVNGAAIARDPVDLQSRISLVGLGDRPNLEVSGTFQIQNPILLKNLSITASTDSYLFVATGTTSAPPLNLTLEDCTLVDDGMSTHWAQPTASPAINRVRLLGKGSITTTEAFIELGTDKTVDLWNDWETSGPVVTSDTGTSSLTIYSGPSSQYTQAPAASTVTEATPAHRAAVVDTTGSSGTLSLTYAVSQTPFVTIGDTPSGDLTAVLSGSYNNREIYVENAVSATYMVRVKNEGSTRTVYMAPGQVRKMWVGPQGTDLRGEALDVFDLTRVIDMDGFTVGDTDVQLLKIPALTVVDRVEVYLTETVAGGTVQVSVGVSGSYNQLLLAKALSTSGDTIGLLPADMGADLDGVSGKLYTASQNVVLRATVASSALTAGIVKVRVVGRYLGE